jgi:hypothetical protein
VGDIILAKQQNTGAPVIVVNVARHGVKLHVLQHRAKAEQPNDTPRSTDTIGMH